MTYQVLARKWRPKTFSDMAGQEHVLQTLIHALNNNRLHHAYLFTGTRGVGKTTIARIFAKCLNCEQGVSSTPCGKCASCVEIAEGRFIDLIEVDAASKTKVEDTRELLDNVQYAPSRGRYKVYLIDEVHMLSQHSFNALLKTLEEPPPHIVFLLATTDPHKLPVTILSRCLQFSLKNLSPQKIVDYLRSVLIAEQFSFEEPALWILAKAAQGSMRDALTLLDQSISFCAGKVNESEVSALLGTPDQALLVKVLEALESSDPTGLLDCVNVIAERSFDYFLFLESLLTSLHRIAVAQLVPGGVDNSQGDREQILGFAQRFAPEDIQLYYQIALNGKQDIAVSHDPRMAFEMLLLRMLVFSPQAVSPGESTSTSTEARKPTSISLPSIENGSTTDEEKKKVDLAGNFTKILENSNSVIEISECTAVILPKIEIKDWGQVVEELGITGITGNLLANCVIKSVDGNRLLLTLDETQSSLFNEEHQKRIFQSLSRYFDAEIEVQISSGKLNTESPAQIKQRQREERILQSLKAFESDKNIQDILQNFSAHIVQNSISVVSEAKS
ncbi:MAG: DNA polymerase III subunit gamma/tau [Gammaproteobacteria bacterium]|nr:DNA polymerase III subunit gamma/tau [Gammaproteobacteria bacterium]